MIDKFFHSVSLDVDLCKGCINCIKHCPTDAIRVREGKASINSKFCIDCGECIRICPHHAKTARYDRIDVINKHKYNIVLTPPSLYGQFNNLDDVNIVLNALLLLGFDEVFEVSAAAEIVSEITRKYIAQHKEDCPLISTACPTIIRLIRTRFPNLLCHLLPIKPPVEIAAEMALERAIQKTGLPREEIGITFITPCPSKVAYIKSPLGIKKSEIDYAVAIKDIYPLLLPFMKEVDSASMNDLVETGRIGIGWGESGGEALGILRDDYLAADGIHNCIRVLEDLEDEKISDLSFIELNSCDGGCVGGTLTVENPYLAAAKLKKLRKYMPIAVTHLDESLEGELAWDENVEYEPVFKLGENMKESMLKMARIEKLEKKLPGLDCGSCGAPTCRLLAEDIVRGEASKKDCIYYLKEGVQKYIEEINIVSKGMLLGNNEKQVAALQQYIVEASQKIFNEHYGDQMEYSEGEDYDD